MRAGHSEGALRRVPCQFASPEGRPELPHRRRAGTQRTGLLRARCSLPTAILCFAADHQKAPAMSVLSLHGYRYSVYTRIVRVVLEEKGLSYETHEVDPFSGDLGPTYAGLHPFGLVPALSHGSFSLFETSVIARYIDAAFEGHPLTPSTATDIARMAQVIAITDTYGYRPMVRQVFAHRVFRPLVGETPCEAEISSGLAASREVLAALEAIAAEGKALSHGQVTLADCHLAPMVDYFVAAPEGLEMLHDFPALSAWWSQIEKRQSIVRTDPGRPRAGD